MNKPSPLNRGLLLVPLIGASDSLINAMGLWTAWMLISLGHGLAMSLSRPHLTAWQRILVSLVLVATLTTCTDLVAQAWLPQLYGPSSLYIGWIALSCMVLAHDHSFIDSGLRGHFKLAGMFGLSMIGLGALRELIGHGTPIALATPGGFLLLGLLLAASRAWTSAKPSSSAEEMPRP